MDGSNLWRVLFLALVTTAQSQNTGPTGGIQAFLNEVEREVMIIAQSAIANLNNSTALLATCDESSCSKHICTNAAEDRKFPLSCVRVTQNEACEENNSTCTTLLVSTQRSYVRIPPRVPDPSKLTCDMASTVCVQRALDDDVFKRLPLAVNLSFGNFTGRAYFGSSNGVFRIYPGSEEQAVSLCGKYDPRKRPWYKGVTAILKDVILLLDSGPGMAARGTASQINLFAQAASIASEFLDTLGDDDYVTVYNFNSSGAHLLSERVIVSADVSKIMDKINGLLPEVVTQGANANLTAAIATLSQAFWSNSMNLKTIIILTSGNVEAGNLSVGVIPTLIEEGVRVFIYQLLVDQSNNGAGDLLQSLACSIEASYETHAYDAQDPLSVVQSFYSYVAYRRFQIDNGSVLWVPVFEDYSGFGQIITTAFPAFNGSTLVGVAGIDIVVDKIPDVNNALLDRKTLRTLNDKGTSLSCNVASKSTCAASTVTSDALCMTEKVEYSNMNEGEASKLLKERLCCKGQCGWEENSALSTGALAGIITGGVVGVLTVLCTLLWLGKQFGFCAPKAGDNKPVENNGLLVGNVRPAVTEVGRQQPSHGGNDGNENPAQQEIADPPKGYYDETL